MREDPHVIRECDTGHSLMRLVFTGADYDIQVLNPEVARWRRWLDGHESRDRLMFSFLAARIDEGSP